MKKFTSSARTEINKIRNILNQHNALLESLLTCFIKKFSKDLWTHIKRWHNDNENNKKLCYIVIRNRLLRKQLE